MKYIHQFLIIMFISLIGELLSLLPLPVPASVYGLLILLVCLFTGLIKLKDIEDVADWLILIMPVLFVPAAVSLMNVGDEMLGDLLVIGVVLIVSTIVVMVVTGKVAQYMIERKENHG
ncbi:CidA/LrgA family protein [Candidatus Stoquefichus massiliensis]|uniref:CidA/LrgA family protein n=1 Tax=Candidatus Stoquefichus massiliensis TaxID=1470350 RepID=UPI000485BF99|nr:CidA/LrgA family protein [Candidatus Stoquefichus massiliensis]